MNSYKVLALAGVIALAGCASSSPKSSAEPVVEKSDPVLALAPDQTANLETTIAPEKKMRCKRIKPTGSHRTQLVCTSPEQDAQTSRQTQDAIRRNQSRSGCVGCGGDG